MIGAWRTYSASPSDKIGFLTLEVFGEFLSDFLTCNCLFGINDRYRRKSANRSTRIDGDESREDKGTKGKRERMITQSWSAHMCADRPRRDETLSACMRTGPRRAPRCIPGPTLDLDESADAVESARTVPD